MGFLLLSVYWFNPIIWAAYIFLCRDIEAACDEKVISNMNPDSLRAYSEALLNCSINRRTITACPIAFGEVGVKERVKNVMNYKKPAFWIILIAVLACIVVAVCFLTSPKGEYRMPWDQFCISAEGHEITLSAEDKKYVAKLLNHGTWADDARAPEEWNYQFFFAEQTVRYDSQSGIFSDDMKKKSMTVSETERQKINRMLGHFDGTAEGRIHVPDSGHIELIVKEIDVLSDHPGITLWWHNLTDEDFTFGLEYCLYHYENGQYVRMPQNDNILVDAIAILLMKDGRREVKYNLSAFDITPAEKYRLYLSSFEQSDYWIDFICGDENVDISQTENAPPAMTVTDGITKIKAVTGTYTWFSSDSSTGTNHCTEADSPSFDSKEMRDLLPVISTKPSTMNLKISNEVVLQFIGTKPDRVNVSCMNNNVQNTNSIVWEPVEVLPDFTIELLEGSHIYKVEADFGESHVSYGFIGGFVVPLIIVNGDGENPDPSVNGHSNEKDVEKLKEKYPEYFGLPTMKGLEVYVWQMAANSYSFGLLSGTNRLKTQEELWNLKGASASEMKAILSTYHISDDMIAVIPFQNILSSYIADYWISQIGESESSKSAKKEAYIQNIRDMLFEN